MSDDPKYLNQPAPVPDSDNEYPAAGGHDLISTAFQWAISPGYGNSVSKGANELVAHLNHRYGTARDNWVSNCAQETLVLSGYSQGADVVGWVLQRSDLSQAARNHIGYVALYGDPKLDPGTLTQRQKWQRPWWVRGDDTGFRYNKNGDVLLNSGVLGSRNPYVPAWMSTSRFGSWCAYKDGVCTGSFVPTLDEGTHGKAYQDQDDPHVDGWISISAAEIANRAIQMRNALNPSLPRATAPSFTVAVPDPAVSTPVTVDNTAAVSWPNPVHLPDMTAARTILAAPNGDVAVSCSMFNSPVAVKSIAAAGNVNWGFEHSNATGRNPDGCDNLAIGNDGTVYAVSTDDSNGAFVSAYKGGSELWATQVNTACMTNSPSTVKVGYDGNVYTTIDNQGMCSSGRRLMGFNAATGAVLFNTALGNDQAVIRPDSLQPYAGGLAVWWGRQFRYFSYSGAEQSSTQLTMGNGEFIIRVTGGSGGKLYAMVVKNQPTTVTCKYSQVLSRIVALGPSGQLWQYNASACRVPSLLNTTPFDGVTFGQSDDGGNDRQLGLDSTGHVSWTYVPDTGNDGQHQFDVAGLGAYTDNNGNVLVTHGYHSPDGQRQGVQINLLDAANGTRRTTIYTDELEANKSFQQVYLASSTDRLYVLGKPCDSQWYCAAGSTALYAVGLVGMGMDYPRAAALK
jgi:hypothetical protein